MEHGILYVLERIKVFTNPISILKSAKEMTPLSRPLIRMIKLPLATKDRLIRTSLLLNTEIDGTLRVKQTTKGLFQTAPIRSGSIVGISAWGQTAASAQHAPEAVLGGCSGVSCRCRTRASARCVRARTAGAAPSMVRRMRTLRSGRLRSPPPAPPQYKSRAAA